MSNFKNLHDILRSLETDPSTADHPIKRMFLCDGEHMTANVGIIGDSSNTLHTQKSHDEIVVILEGEVDFRVGDETQSVRPGDLIFIPKDTIHGPILEEGEKFAALSVFAPYFDRSKQNIVWDRDSAHS